MTILEVRSLYLPLARIVVRDATLQVVVDGSGVVSVDVAPGVYAATVTDGRSRVERLIKVGLEPSPPVDVILAGGQVPIWADATKAQTEAVARATAELGTWACDHVRGRRPCTPPRQRRGTSWRSGVASQSAVLVARHRYRRRRPVPVARRAG